MFSGLPIDDADHFRAFNRIYKGFFQIKSAFTADAFAGAFENMIRILTREKNVCKNM